MAHREGVPAGRALPALLAGAVFGRYFIEACWQGLERTDRMPSNIFQRGEVSKAAEAFARAQLAPEQRQIVYALASTMDKHLAVGELAMSGFAMKAIGEWQVKNGRPLTDLLRMSPRERVACIAEVAALLKAILRSALAGGANPAEVDVAVDEALSQYRTSFARR